MENTENTNDLTAYISAITAGGGLRGWRKLFTLFTTFNNLPSKWFTETV